MKETGFILINKNSDWTSHDVVQKLRSITKIKKIGHAGTLDPFAQGLLFLAIGKKSTKKISEYVHLDKEYIGKMYLGFTSDTYDKTGQNPF